MSVGRLATSIIRLTWLGSSPQVIAPRTYHPDGFDHGAATETDDGCPHCQDEMDDASDEAVEAWKAKGDGEVEETMLVNDPYDTSISADGFWEFQVTGRRAS